MANEMNKVPCGGFKVGGGLSVDDGMLKMGSIIAAEVYVEDDPTSVGLLIPYKAIQFDNPIVTQTLKQGDQTITINLYDAFVGIMYPCYKVIFDKNRKIKQVLLNDTAEPDIISFDVKQESMGSEAFKLVTTDSIKATDAQITYIVSGINIPDEIEEVLHFGGKGWFLEYKG